MNCEISVDNKFIANTNDSENWDIIVFPLPIPQYGYKWSIQKYSDNFTTIYLEEILK